MKKMVSSAGFPIPTNTSVLSLKMGVRVKLIWKGEPMIHELKTWARQKYSKIGYKSLKCTK